MCTVLCLWWLLQDFLGKSDPFLQVSKVKADGGTLLVHRTEVNMTYMYLDPPYHGMGFLHHKKTCPTLPSTGPIFSGKGTGHFSSSGEQIRSWYRINNKLFRGVVGPVSVPNDYLNALFNDVIILWESYRNNVPHGQSLKLLQFTLCVWKVFSFSKGICYL